MNKKNLKKILISIGLLFSISSLSVSSMNRRLNISNNFRDRIREYKLPQTEDIHDQMDKFVTEQFKTIREKLTNNQLDSKELETILENGLVSGSMKHSIKQNYYYDDGCSDKKIVLDNTRRLGRRYVEKPNWKYNEDKKEEKKNRPIKIVEEICETMLKNFYGEGEGKMLEFANYYKEKYLNTIERINTPGDQLRKDFINYFINKYEFRIKLKSIIKKLGIDFNHFNSFSYKEIIGELITRLNEEHKLFRDTCELYNCHYTTYFNIKDYQDELRTALAEFIDAQATNKKNDDKFFKVLLQCKPIQIGRLDKTEEKDAIITYDFDSKSYRYDIKGIKNVLINNLYLKGYIDKRGSKYPSDEDFRAALQGCDDLKRILNTICDFYAKFVNITNTILESDDFIKELTKVAPGRTCPNWLEKLK